MDIKRIAKAYTLGFSVAVLVTIICIFLACFLMWTWEPLEEIWMYEFWAFVRVLVVAGAPLGLIYDALFVENLYA